MDTLLKADIFFFISSIGVVIGIIIFGIVGWYTIKILKDIKEIAAMVKTQTGITSAQIDELIGTIKESFIFNLIFWKKPKRSIKK